MFYILNLNTGLVVYYLYPEEPVKYTNKKDAELYLSQHLPISNKLGYFEIIEVPNEILHT